MFGIDNMIKNNVYNGRTADGLYCNAHLFYRGLSVIVDYEHILHDYENEFSDTVPVEIYPIGDDIEVFEVRLSDEFGKADIMEIIQKIDKIIDKDKV